MIFSAGNTDTVTVHELEVTETIVEIMDSPTLSDTVLACFDGKMRVPRVLLALAYPSLYGILRDREEEEITLILPQFRSEEVVARLWHRVTDSLGGRRTADEGSAEDDSLNEESEDDTYNPSELIYSSDTEILDEADELVNDLKELGVQPQLRASRASSNKKRDMRRKRKPFSQLRSLRHMRRRLQERCEGVENMTEALSVIRRLHRQYPDTKTDTVTNIALLTLVRVLRLSHNSVRKGNYLPFSPNLITSL